MGCWKVMLPPDSGMTEGMITDFWLCADSAKGMMTVFCLFAESALGMMTVFYFCAESAEGMMKFSSCVLTVQRE
jgi:hypothetical protein